MPLKKETIYVSESPIGWTVKRHDGRKESGPYTDRENALASALAIAKQLHAQHVKVSRAVGECSVECVFQEGQSLG